MDRILEESRQSVTCAICADVYDDPRTLTCSHSFCLHCLIEFRGAADERGNKFCPICRKLTVPPIAHIQTLPHHDFANKVARLIKDNSRTDLLNDDAPEGDQETTDDLILGDFIKEPESESAKRYRGAHVGASVVAGAVVTMATGGLLGVVAGLAVFGFGAVTSVEMEKRKKRSYECSGCRVMKFCTLRYRCGMCDDFNLCPSCFENKRAVSRLHNSQHLFLKLKFLQRRQLPRGTVIKPKIDDMVKSMDYQSTTHGRCYVHSPQRLIIVPAIQCKSCGESPIVGDRFKCGMCKNYDLCGRCEDNSEDIHGKDHVFIVLRNHSEINLTAEPLLRAYFY